MDRDTQHQVLQFVIAAWGGLQERRRPQSLWLHLHEPIAVLADGFTTPLLAVCPQTPRSRRGATWSILRSCV